MELQIDHLTVYDYTPAVETAQHRVHLRPLETMHQTVLGHALNITPHPGFCRSSLDAFGNTQTHFSLAVPHTRLEVAAQSRVVTRAPQALPDDSLNHPVWTTVPARFAYHKGMTYDPACEFSFASPHVPHHADFLAYASPSFEADTPVLQGVIDLMQRMHQDFTYASQSTEVNTPARVALAQRKGVCQDFAHIMLACLRSLGLSAQYVSGYLLTHPPEGQPRLIGSDASHAWVSVYVPDLAPENPSACWCDFDPTNNRWGWGTPGEDYVTLARGRDFADVSPLRGVIHGGSHHRLSVAVTVWPVTEGSPLESSATGS